MNRTPLHLAVESNSKDLIEIILSKGADINAFDNQFQTIIILFLTMINENHL